MTTKRAAVFTASYTPYKPYLDAQFSDLLNRGWTLTIYSQSAPGPMSSRANAHDLGRLVVRYPSTLRSTARLLGSTVSGALRHPSATLRTAAAIRRSKGLSKAALTDMARAAVLRPEPPDFCLVHELETAIGFQWLRTRYPTSKVAMHYHGGEIPSIPRIPNPVARRTLNSFDVIFTNTEFAASQVRERGGDPRRIHVLPVGFHLDDFQDPVDRSYRPDGALRLLSAGRLSSGKGFQVAIRALTELRSAGLTDFRYDIAGNGPMAQALQEQIAGAGLEDHVRLLGRLDHGALINRMADADIFVLPSLAVGNWAETQACVVQEALLMRTPVLVTATGGVPECIPPSFHPDHVVAERDVTALADGLRRLAGLSVERLATLGEIGRRYVEDRFDVRELNRRLLDRLVSSPGREARPEAKRPPQDHP